MPRAREPEPCSLQPCNVRVLPLLSPSAVPDDVWLRVLALLPTQDLLSARLVCSRWRDLAALPEPWRHRRLPSRQRHLVAAALRVAPRVRALEFGISSSHASRNFAQLAASTECACEELQLTLYSMSEGPNGWSEEVDLTERALRRQAELGRLRRLELDLDSVMDIASPASKERLARVILSLRLTHLDVNGEFDAAEPLADWPPPPMPIRMKTLALWLYGCSELVLQLLSQHADSLEELGLWDNIEEDSTGAAHALALAVSKCVSLRSAELPLEAAVPTLALPELRSLTVNGMYSEDPLELHLADAGMGSQLHHLELHSSESLQIATSIASSGRAQLRELSLWERTSVEQLRGFILGLPHLQVLVLPYLPPVQLLRAISPGTAPSLRLLSLRHPDKGYWSPFMCRLPDLKELLLRNPLLHVNGLAHPPHSRDGDKDPRCECCRLLGGACTPRRAVYFGLYGHAEGAACEWHNTRERDAVSCNLWLQCGHVDAAS